MTYVTGGATAPSGALSMDGFALTNLGEGPASSSAARLADLANMAQAGFAVAASTESVTLSGLSATIDGVSLSSGNVVLLTGQSTASENGPWVVASGAWSRPTWYDTGASIEQILVTVSGGTANGPATWSLWTVGPVTVDTTATSWVNVAGGHAPGVINVKHPAYGALGDGTNDDTIAITAALTAAAALSGICYFPPGTYVCNDASTPFVAYPGSQSAYITIQGAGEGATTLVATENVFAVLQVRMAGEVTDMTISGGGYTISNSPLRMCNVNTNNTARCTIGHFGVRRVTVTDISPSSEWLANIGDVLNSALPAVDEIVLEDVTFLGPSATGQDAHSITYSRRVTGRNLRYIGLCRSPNFYGPRSVKLDGVTVELTSRTDTATVISGSPMVFDSSIQSVDNSKPVTGTGIPANTYVGTVTPGTSFLLSSSPTSQVNVNATANGTAVTLPASNPDISQLVLDGPPAVLAVLSTPITPGVPITSLSVIADPHDPRTVGTCIYVPAGTALQLSGTHNETVVTSAAVTQGANSIPIVSYTPTYSYDPDDDVNVWVPAVHEVANLEVIDRWFEETGIAVPASRTDDNGAVDLYANAKFSSTGRGELEVNVPGIYDAQVKLASCNIDSGIDIAGNLASLNIAASSLGVRVAGTSYSCISVAGGVPVASLNAGAVVVNGTSSLGNAPLFNTGNSSSSITESNFVGCHGLNISALVSGPGSVVANIVDGTGFFAAAVQSGFTSPPVSGTAYQNGSNRSVTLYQTVTLNPSNVNTATVTLSTSPDGVSYTQIAELQIPASANAWSGQVETMVADVPPGWFFEFVATHAALGTLLAIG